MVGGTSDATGAGSVQFCPVALAYLAEAVPTRHRATAIGAMSTSFLVAGILGQVFAAWWRYDGIGSGYF